MKILITGANGQLGYDVVKESIARGNNTVGIDLAEKGDIAEIQYHKLDITEETSINKIMDQVKPDWVIHCAAWTAVDDAEDEENIEKVFEINERATRYIAEACKEYNCKMIYISTDYVFDGSGEMPWEADSTNYNPQNIYGKSKLAGELAVSSILKDYYIVRIAWVFGLHGNNFVKTMLNVGKKYDEIRVVSDQIGSPTYTKDLAKILLDMTEKDKFGYYHVTNEGGYISWYDFVVEIYSKVGLQTKITPVTTEEYGISKAKRPKNSRLDTSKLENSGFQPLPTWKDALSRFLDSCCNR